MRNLNGDKALGPNRFSLDFIFLFFQTYWEVLKVDIMAVFKEFHGRVNFEMSINATFIPLVPKKAGAVDIN